MINRVNESIFMISDEFDRLRGTYLFNMKRQIMKMVQKIILKLLIVLGGKKFSKNLLKISSNRGGHWTLNRLVVLFEII